MGNTHSQLENRLSSITSEIISQRTSSHNISKAEKDTIISTLVTRRGEVSSLKGKVKHKHLEETLRLISEAMEEILEIDPKDANDVNSVSLKNIEATYEELKVQVQTAISNKDGQQLNLHMKTLKALGADLKQGDMPLVGRKMDLYSRLVDLYRRANRHLLVEKKQQQLRTLEDIEVQLAENLSRLDQLVKDKNPEFSRVRSDLRQCQQKLILMDIVDDDVKDKCKVLLIRLTDIGKKLDQLAKREFDSKFSRNLERYERIISKFGTATNLKDSIIKLEALKNSVENLTEVDDCTFNKKLDLFNSINGQLVEFTQTEAAIVQQEQNVKKDRLRQYQSSIPVLIKSTQTVQVNLNRQIAGGDHNRALVHQKLGTLDDGLVGNHNSNVVLEDMKLLTLGGEFTKKAGPKYDDVKGELVGVQENLPKQYQPDKNVSLQKKSNVKADLVKLKYTVQRYKGVNYKIIKHDLLKLKTKLVEMEDSEEMQREVDHILKILEQKRSNDKLRSLEQRPEPDVTHLEISKDIELFETSFNQLKKKITAPVSEEDVHKFHKLTQDIKALMEQVQAIRFIRDSNLHQRQTSLLNEMQVKVDVLEKGAMDADFVINIERQVDKLSSLLDTTPHEDIKLAAQDLQTKLQDQKFTFTNKGLQNRKTDVIQKAADLVEMLKECEDQKKNLDEIDDKLSTLSPHVANFVGVKSQNRYYELNESITRLMVQLDRMDSASDKLLKIRLKLLKDLHGVGRILDERAQQTQDLEDVEKELQKIDERIEAGGGTKEMEQIKNELDNLMKRFTGLKSNNDLAIRQNDCMEKFNFLANKTATMIRNQLDKIMKKIQAVEGQVHECNQINQIYDFREDIKHFDSEINILNISKTSYEYTMVVNLYQKMDEIWDYIRKKIHYYDQIQTIIAKVQQIDWHLTIWLTYDEINNIHEHLIKLLITLDNLQQQQVGFKEDIDTCIKKINMLIQRCRTSTKSTSV